MSKISVIVPVYNTEKYIEKCLDSLTYQTLKDIEIIVINDGSTDRSKEIIDDYAKKYKNIKAYHLQNGGVSKARNFGLKKAKGEYITFLDSDDYIDDNLYEKMYDKAKENDADVCECDYIWEFLKKKRYDYLNKNIHPLLSMRAVVWNRLYKRELLINNKISFHEGVHFEDVEFCYEVFPYIKNFAYVKDVYVHYVQRDNSITSDRTDKLKDIYKVLDGTIQYYKKHHFYDEYKNELEYIYMRYIFGSSFLRMVKIKDHKIRKKMLKESYHKLLDVYPNYKENPYLKEKGKRNFYFRSINKFTFPIYCFLFHLK